MRLWRNIEVLAAFTQQKLIQLRKHLATIIFTYLLSGTSNSTFQLQPNPLLKRQGTKPKISLRICVGKILISCGASRKTCSYYKNSEILEISEFCMFRLATKLSPQYPRQFPPSEYQFHVQ